MHCCCRSEKGEKNIFRLVGESSSGSKKASKKAKRDAKFVLKLATNEN